MSQLSLDDVTKLARLSKLDLSEAEISHFRDQLVESISYVDNLREIDTSEVPDSFFTTDAHNVMDEDVVNESIMLSQEDALKNASSTKNGYFVVKRIL